MTNLLKLDWGGWLYKLMQAFIGGGAGALGTFIGVAGASTTGLVNVPRLDWKVWGVIFLSAAVSGAVLYLAKSPLPPSEDEGATQPKQ